MKFYYPPPYILEANPEEIDSNFLSMGMVAITPEKNIVLVRELNFESIWENFWNDIISKKPKNRIILHKDILDDGKSISKLAQDIVQGLKYIMANGFIFAGLLYFRNNVLDENIIKGGMFFKKKKYFIDMQAQFRNNNIFTPIFEDNSIETSFIGQGEKFFRLKDLSMNQIAQMTNFFRGSLCGIGGMRDSDFEYVILSQNITKDLDVPNFNLDKKGRDTLYNLIKIKKFIPAGGFRFDYGISSLKKLKEWGSIELIPSLSKHIELYLKFLSAMILKQDNPIAKKPIQSVFETNFEIILSNETIKKTLSAEQLLSKTIYNSDSEPVPKSETDSKKNQLNSPLVKSDSTIPAQTNVNINKSQSIPPIHNELIQKISLPIQKPPLEKIGTSLLQKSEIDGNKPKLSDLSNSVDLDFDDEYEDVFNQEKDNDIFKNDGKNILNPDEMNEEFLTNASQFIDQDLGLSINPSLMSQDDVFKDLEASLAAMSTLDDLAHKDEAISRIYFPPPTLISYANKEGMQIGGSTCIISMGVGRNLWMVPELKRMQMWGKFYKDLEGNPQIEDFVAMEEKDIESCEQFEDILQKAFINVRRNNHVFLGLINIEGNGFERNVFDECELDWGDIQKLMEIHINKRTTTEFPELNSENWIDVHYYGRKENIAFIANPESQGILEIANDSLKDKHFSKGVMCGIICVDEEAAYFFILSDNFDDLNSSESLYSIDEVTLKKLYDLVSTTTLTPVSWFKIEFGFRSFESLFLWEELNEGVILPLVKENYDNYIKKLLKSKVREDGVRKKIEAEFPEKQNK